MDSKEKQKILTVSVAAYNVEEYLREVLDSFIGLPQMNLVEVFVVDDGGNDSSLDIAKEYEERYPDTFHAVHKENGGWGSTVNYSIQHATGKYFRLLDGDDYYNTDHLSLFIDYLQQHDADLFISSFASFQDESNIILEEFSSDAAFKENEIYKLDELQKPILLAMHSFTVRTTLLQEHNIRLKEHVLYRDMEFTAYILTYASTVMFFSLPIYYYRLGREGQSVSRSSYIKHIDEHADIVYSILAISELLENKQKKNYLYGLARGTCLVQYLIYFYDKKVDNVKNKLIKFDQHVKAYPDFYVTLNLPLHIRMLQRMNFTGYGFVMSLLTIRRRLRGNIS